jgi:magnesium chelatase family protein
MQSFSFKVVGDRARVVPVIVSEQEAKFTVCSGTIMEGVDVATRVSMAASFADVELPGAVVDVDPDAVLFCDFAVVAALFSEPGQTKLTGYAGRFSYAEGKAESVRAAYAFAVAAREHGLEEIVLPWDSACDVCGVEGVVVRGVSNFEQLLRHVKGEELAPEIRPLGSAPLPVDYDTADIRQPGVVRAMEVAAAGRLGLLLVGPPGSNKTHAARRMTSILPEQTKEEREQAWVVQSIRGLQIGQWGRPFRAPHYTVSNGALLGTSQGKIAKTGEVSLASGGVLYLDEAPEFQRSALEALAGAWSKGSVSLRHRNEWVNSRTLFQLVASANSCPCGQDSECECTAQAKADFLGRMDALGLALPMAVKMERMLYDRLAKTLPGRSSAEVRKSVTAAMAFVVDCGEYRTPPPVNGAAGIVARVIADLEGRAQVLPHHVEEAMGLVR